jgi:hypothetical protein
MVKRFKRWIGNTCIVIKLLLIIRLGEKEAIMLDNGRRIKLPEKEN